MNNKQISPKIDFPTLVLNDLSSSLISLWVARSISYHPTSLVRANSVYQEFLNAIKSFSLRSELITKPSRQTFYRGLKEAVKEGLIGNPLPNSFKYSEHPEMFQSLAKSLKTRKNDGIYFKNLVYDQKRLLLNEIQPLVNEDKRILLTIQEQNPVVTAFFEEIQQALPLELEKRKVSKGQDEESHFFQNE